MTRSRERFLRGLTLLEVLVSVALLATLASAIVPLLRDLSSREPKPAALPPDLLGQAADALLASKDARAFDALLIGESMTREWPSTPSRPQDLGADQDIKITRKASGSPDSLEGTWWMFTCGDTVVVRYSERPPSDEGGR